MSNANTSLESLSTNTSVNNDRSIVKQKIKSLVVDSGPLIKGINVRSFAEKIYTIPEVINEIRDKHSRDFLNQISFDLQIKVPSDEALKEVVNFSKKTGDFTSLSAVDLRVIALTYMLEVEANGTGRLRKEPVKSRTKYGDNNKKPNKSPKKKLVNKSESTEIVNKQEQQRQIDESNLLSNLENLQLTDITVESLSSDGMGHQNGNLYQVENSKRSNNIDLANDHSLSKEEPIVEISVNDTEKDDNDSIMRDSDPKSVNQKKDEISDVRQDEDYDDNDIEWITPDNIDDYQAKEQNSSVNLKKDNLENIKIACMTTDYSMQNVLLQMRLNLISVEGKRIKKVKNWVLRCHACFKITTNMEKKFCPNCGNATLIRTSTSTDANGNVTYYLKKNFQYNLRGTKYSIPEPKGGRHANNIILREDQKEYQKALKSQKKQKEIDIFDPDYVPKLLIGSNISKSINPVIGYGRRNPNEARRGKSKGRKKR
ncbi:Nin one binding Zn-ribbon like-domain-containing protein [Glomus cerebriforme]|uniref:20S-pre-rRNA D-site endonuclease NOB1 n=1 Tax=Glomus cerebriforme TaxID=658196 RepID=A0A397SBB2_9GLOM|nr:Nin one binding Zn-ribbon like-domain-containing protein [Glomus cerebriforme]